MVCDGQDNTKFEKTMALLKKYDPTYAPPAPSLAAATSGTLAFGGQDALFCVLG